MRAAIQVNDGNSKTEVKNFVKKVFPEGFQPVSPVGNGYIIGESGNKHFFYTEEVAFAPDLVTAKTLILLIKEDITV